MNKFIITTTINSPTKATVAYCQIAASKNWKFVIIGDTKTPHSEYRSLQEKYKGSVFYLSPDIQTHMYKELSDSIGWKTIQRRNVGFVYAYDAGADFVATVDDDNIPYSFWGDAIYIGKEVEIDIYEPKFQTVFDPLSITKHNHVWHRGFPIEYVPDRHNVEYKGKTNRKVLIQSDLWDGDPDIDALARLTYKPIINYKDITGPYGSSKISPFNSQNTFIDRSVLSDYMVLPNIGRMDDIWGSYLLQYHFPNSVVYNKATVYQDRNVQDLITNLEKEIIGYRNTLKFVENILSRDLNKSLELLPDSTRKFVEIYKNSFK